MSSTEICIKLFTRRRILSAEIGDVRSQLAWFLSDNSGIMFDVKTATKRVAPGFFHWKIGEK